MVGGSLPAERHLCASVDAVANHVPAGWPDGSLAGSDSEEPGEQPRLKVETRVSVELHLDEQGHLCSERVPDRDSGGPKPAAAPPSQPPEQRKGAERAPAALNAGGGGRECGRGRWEVPGPGVGGGVEAGTVQAGGAGPAGQGLAGLEFPLWHGGIQRISGALRRKFNPQPGTVG